MPEPLQLPTPTPVSDDSSPLRPSPGSSTARPSWQQITSQLVGSAVVLGTALKLASWFGPCLEIVKLPAGGVTHDLWSWAPLVCDVLAIVAVAAPVSFRSLLELAKGIIAKRTA